MPFDEYPKPPARGRDSDGDLQDLQVDNDGKAEVSATTAEALLYSIDRKLETLIELLKGLI